MIDRRAFLGAVTGVAALDPSRAREVLASLPEVQASPQETAGHEAFWSRIQQAFPVDRSIVNLNSGYASPAPATAIESFKRHIDFSNLAPARTMVQILEPQKEGVRARLARAFGADAEEIAITRNASEGLEICQFGIDLKPGDEVLCTDQDYPRMITTFQQRARREGIKVRTLPIPVPCEEPGEITARYEKGITERTRMILVCHVINLTGQILPVREIARLGRERGIPVVVDGAHAFANLVFTNRDLECDYYATSLHKWLFAPMGTGMLYVRRDKIAGVWPLMAAAASQDGDIRKFEEIGTHPAANALAIAEALTFHEGIGPERKLARLLHLRDRWARRLARHERVRLQTSLKPGAACGMATVGIEGIEPNAITGHLWSRHRIFVAAIGHNDVKGIRVSPSVWTTLEEIDRFSEAMEEILRKGIK